MIDPIGLPVILKSLDFLFGEAQKILQERRERRAAKNISTQDNNNKRGEETIKVNSPTTIRTIDDALSIQISENILKHEISEIEHLLRLKDTYSKRYQIAKEKISIYGTLETPYKVLHELEEAEGGIEDVAIKLRSSLSKIYNKEIVIND